MIRGPARIAAALLAFVLLGGCGAPEEPAPTAPLPQGLIAGRMDIGGATASLWVVATRVTRQYVSHRDTYTAEAAPDGSYSLPLPPGRFVVEGQVRSHCCSPEQSAWFNRTGPPYTYENRDTLDISDGTSLEVDFHLASAQVTIAVPNDMKSGSMQLQLFHPNQDPGVAPFNRYEEWAYPGTGQASFSFLAIDPGSYQARLLVNGKTSLILWLPGTRDRAAAETLAVPAGKSVTVHRAPFGATATVQGSITGSWQKLGLPPPVVTLLRADSVGIASFSPGDDGSFSVPCYLPEPFKVVVDFGDSRRWYQGTSFRDAAVIDLHAGETSPPIDMVESGLLLDISDPTYQQSWEARLELVDPQTLAAVRSVRIRGGLDSPFQAVSNLDPGSYLLHVLPDPFLDQDWLEQWYDGAARPEDAAPIAILPDGAVTRARLALRAGGRISGTIWYENTPDTFGAVLYLTRADNPVAIGDRHAGSGGGLITWSVPIAYALRGLPDGQYKLGIAPWKNQEGRWPAQPPEGTVWYPKAATWAEGDTLTIQSAQTVQGVDFDLR